MTHETHTRDRFTDRVAEADWTAVKAELDEHGSALLPRLLSSDEAAEIAALYDEPRHFRATVDMKRYRFGQGEYRYFTDPFPEAVQRLREELYPRLLPVARDWARKLKWDATWPDTLSAWLAECHEAGQRRPTPILLRYQTGDWNALHRDLYGDKVFPLQVVINLNQPGVDHTGGEFLTLEQRPRAQSRGSARLIPHGHGLVFTTRDRPVASTRGWSAAPMRHGVSVLRSGRRHTLGLVFHDAT
ncbi:2OG-Fe(II) oxygenase [Stackebrandtia nassauensis]|uniref:Fe2OG dioxygenase domain-containing protein n=1 Tax=Stackebrandtia nassauensis (strain DSM 44728 / CIP 108903 / NRRL B-16338 / NBRC 102104 / LLR-40K-21) TaxID=446470 RepID=D3Q1Q6_STANL|nr:2OG-Fe(II) oxygenase [Stackebrandtia nassauensis]ADD39904.1 conserved hypothetical protein [Stackebrandtia nassauensis DSM 44728]